MVVFTRRFSKVEMVWILGLLTDEYYQRIQHICLFLMIAKEYDEESIPLHPNYKANKYSQCL
jgi:hypothetical protein